MRYYKCTVLVAVPESELGGDFDGGDEGFLLQAAVNDAGGYAPRSTTYLKTTVHLIDEGFTSLSGEEFKKARNAGCWAEGGV